MSHFVVLVVGEDVEDQLAPYDENLEVPRYKNREYIEFTLNRATEAGVDTSDLDALSAYVATHDDEEYGVDDEGLFEWSTYNPQRFGLVLADGKRGKAGQSTGDEVLFQVRDDLAAGDVSEGVEVTRRAIHVLLPMHSGPQQVSDNDTSPTLAYPAEVRNDRRPIQRISNAPVEQVRGLLADDGHTLRNGSRSRPHHGGSAGIALSEVQHGDWLAPGFSIRASSSSELPTPPSGYEWVIVGGSKWDWYSVGGRWRGYFALKSPIPLLEKFTPIIGRSGVFDNLPEHDADVALRGQIDFATAREKAVAEAHERYDKFERVTEGITPPAPWSEFRALFGDDIDAARRAWRDNPWIKALRSNDLDSFDDTHETWAVGQGGRETVVANARNAVYVPYAYVRDGKWHERGTMGWFGISRDEVPRDFWLEQVATMFDELSDDTLITALDCHI